MYRIFDNAVTPIKQFIKKCQIYAKKVSKVWRIFLPPHKIKMTEQTSGKLPITQVGIHILIDVLNIHVY